MKQYVIIGGGVAAVGCIEGIRSVDKDSKIVMITDENRPTYCRPLISYYLQSKTDFERMKYRPDSFWSDNNCELVYAKATSIDSGNSTVQLDNGSSVKYDSLCIATGSSPFVPPFSGLETVDKKFTFMTEDDALAIQNAVTKESRVLIVGAGLIGLKCAEGLSGLVKSITVCDLADRVLSSILDAPCAKLMQNVLEENGVAFELSDSAERFDKNTAYMKSKKEIEFDVLILAVGVKANISLIKDIGGECDRGIIVDTSMKTSLDNIYAAGDCTQGYDASIGSNRVLAIMPNAYIGGKCAGVNMAGGDDSFDNAIPMNAIGFFSLHSLTAGAYDGEMIEEKTESSVKRLFIKDNRLNGFMLIGDVDKAGIYTALIRNKTELDSVDFELLKKSPSLLGFSQKYRSEKLGGVV